MANSVFRFPCPCCDRMIEVDTRSGKARAVRPDEQQGGKDLGSLLDAHKNEQQRLDDLFSSAQDNEAKRGEQLDQQLRRAKREAKKDGDERPRNIFDLD